MHIQLQVEIVLGKKSLGRWKNPQEIPSCNSQLPGPHTNAQLPGPRTIYQLLFLQIISKYQLSFVKPRTIYQLLFLQIILNYQLSFVKPRTKPRTTIRPRTPYGFDSAALEDQVRHVGTVPCQGSRLRAATFPIDAYPLTRPPIRTIMGPGKRPRKQCRKRKPYVSLGGP